MEITPNSSNSNNTSVATLPVKVKQLVQSYANKPFLIEKLVLNRTQGLLLKLANDNNNLNLQLPVDLADTVKTASQTKLQITIALSANQRVLIYLSQLNSSSTGNNYIAQASHANRLTLPAHLTLPTQPPVPVNLGPQTKSSQPAQLNQPVNSAPIILQFSKAQLSNQSNLKLSSANTATVTQIKLLSSLVPDDLVLKNYLSDLNQVKANPSQLSASSAKINHDVALPTLDSKSAVANAANQILRTHFSNQQPISKHLTKLQDLSLKIQVSGTTTKLHTKLVSQIENLIQSIKISSQPTANDVKQRVFTSGNFLETNLKNLSKGKPQVANFQYANTEKLMEVKPLNLLNNTSKSLKTQVVPNKVSDPLNQMSQPPGVPNTNDHKTPADIKLQLLQIRTSLEALISQLVKGGIANSQQPIASAQQQASQSVLHANRTDATPKESTTLPANTSLTSPKTDTKLDPLISGLSAQIKFARKPKQSTSGLNSTLLLPLKELLSEVKNIVSQIESHQLQTLKNEQINLHQILVDLPFGKESDIDSFEMLFENRDENAEQSAVKAWKVVVRFDLEPLGPMFAQVELKDERISTHIFAESKQTALLIDDHLHVLKKSLFKAGVDINELKGSQGKIPEKLIINDDGKVDLHI